MSFDGEGTSLRLGDSQPTTLRPAMNQIKAPGSRILAEAKAAAGCGPRSMPANQRQLINIHLVNAAICFIPPNPPPADLYIMF